MNLQERLKEALHTKGAKAAHLAKATGATRATVSDWVNGKTKAISPEYLFSAAQFLGVSEEWLSSGKGPRKRSGAKGYIAGTNNIYSDSMTTPTEDGGRNKEQTDVQSYELWSGSVDSEIRDMSIPTSWLSDKGFKAADVVSIEVPDDSQGPRILKGDYAAIATKYGERPKNNTLYAIKIGGIHTLRLTAYQRNGDLKLCCQNDSYAHAEELVPENEIDSLDVLGEYAGATIRP